MKSLNRLPHYKSSNLIKLSNNNQQKHRLKLLETGLTNSVVICFMLFDNKTVRYNSLRNEQQAAIDKMKDISALKIVLIINFKIYSVQLVNVRANNS